MSEPLNLPEDPAPEVSADTVAELLFDFLRQLSTLSLASAGGTITLMQTVFQESQNVAFLIGGVVAFFLAALTALQTQQVMVERLAAGTRTLKPRAGSRLNRLKMQRTPDVEQRLMYIAFFFFGIGLAAVGMAIFSDLLA